MLLIEQLESRRYAHHHKVAPVVDPSLVETAAFVTEFASGPAQAISLSQFDPALGTLLGVKVETSTTYHQSLSIAADSVGLLTYEISATGLISGPGVNSNSLSEIFGTVAGSDVAQVISGPGVPQTQLTLVTDPTNMAQYVGSGHVAFIRSGTGSASSNSSGDIVAFQTSVSNQFYAGSVTITYDYLAAPQVFNAIDNGVKK